MQTEVRRASRGPRGVTWSGDRGRALSGVTRRRDSVSETESLSVLSLRGLALLHRSTPRSRRTPPQCAKQLTMRPTTAASHETETKHISAIAAVRIPARSSAFAPSLPAYGRARLAPGLHQRSAVRVTKQRRASGERRRRHGVPVVPELGAHAVAVGARGAAEASIGSPLLRLPLDKVRPVAREE